MPAHYKVIQPAMVYWIDPKKPNLVPLDAASNGLAATPVMRVGQVVYGDMVALSYTTPGQLAGSPPRSGYFLKIAPNRFLKSSDVLLMRNESGFSEQAPPATTEQAPAFSVSKTEVSNNMGWLYLTGVWVISLLILFFIVYLISKAWKKGQQAT